MRLRFSGFTQSLEIASGKVAVLEVHNKALFSRVCQSLFIKDISTVPESFALWDDDGVEVSFVRNSILVANPLLLPWEDKALVNGARTKLLERIMEDEGVRQSTEMLAQKLSSEIAELCLQMNGNYGFVLEWDPARYLTSFGFGPEVIAADSLIDNLIRYLDFIADVAADKVLVFVNLKIFLDEKGQQRFFERVFLHGLYVLLLEEVPDSSCRDNQAKLVVDQDFLEE